MGLVPLDRAQCAWPNGPGPMGPAHEMCQSAGPLAWARPEGQAHGGGLMGQARRPGQGLSPWAGPGTQALSHGQELFQKRVPEIKKFILGGC